MLCGVRGKDNGDGRMDFWRITLTIPDCSRRFVHPSSAEHFSLSSNTYMFFVGPTPLNDCLFLRSAMVRLSHHHLQQTLRAELRILLPVDVSLLSPTKEVLCIVTGSCAAASAFLRRLSSYIVSTEKSAFSITDPANIIYFYRDGHKLKSLKSGGRMCEVA